MTTKPLTYSLFLSTFALVLAVAGCEKDDNDDDGHASMGDSEGEGGDSMDEGDDENGEAGDESDGNPTFPGGDASDGDPTDADPTDADPTDADPTDADPTDADPTGEEPPSDGPCGGKSEGDGCVDPDWGTSGYCCQSYNEYNEPIGLSCWEDPC